MVADLWSPTQMPALICVTSNSSASEWGYLFMGAGSARQATERYGYHLRKRAADLILAAHPELVLDGTGVYGFQIVIQPTPAALGLALFQTKRDYRDAADLGVIAESARQLHAWTTANPTVEVRMPLPGTGGTQARTSPPSRDEVEALLLSLPDNVYVCKKSTKITKPKETSPCTAPSAPSSP
jgi:hypothetical protein